MTGAIGEATRASLAVDAFALTAGYDAQIASELARRTANASDPLPERLDLHLDRVLSLRYGENPHQAAALYRRADVAATPARSAAARRRCRARSSATTTSSTRQRRPRSLATCAARPWSSSSTATRAGPQRRKRCTCLGAALSGDPVSAFGGVVGIRGTVDAALADRAHEPLPRGRRGRRVRPRALELLARKSNLRLLADPASWRRPSAVHRRAIRRRGGAGHRVPTSLPTMPAAGSWSRPRAPPAPNAPTSSWPGGSAGASTPTPSCS